MLAQETLCDVKLLSLWEFLNFSLLGVGDSLLLSREWIIFIAFGIIEASKTIPLDPSSFTLEGRFREDPSSDNEDPYVYLRTLSNQFNAEMCRNG